MNEEKEVPSIVDKRKTQTKNQDELPKLGKNIAVKKPQLKKSSVKAVNKIRINHENTAQKTFSKKQMNTYFKNRYQDTFGGRATQDKFWKAFGFYIIFRILCPGYGLSLIPYLGSLLLTLFFIRFVGVMRCRCHDVGLNSFLAWLYAIFAITGWWCCGGLLFSLSISQESELARMIAIDKFESQAVGVIVPQDSGSTETMGTIVAICLFIELTTCLLLGLEKSDPHANKYGECPQDTTQKEEKNS